MVRRLLYVVFAFFSAGARGQYENCTGPLSAINDGRCDTENNVVECHFDGGDCCYCSCENDRLYPCGFGGYRCLDPDTADESSGCANGTASVNPCPTDIPQTWIVNDTVSATSLAEMVSGGTFNVTCQGSVLIDRTISVQEGTSVYVTGEGSGAEINGGGEKRQFVVEGAVLHVDRPILSDGNATVEGETKTETAQGGRGKN